MRINLTSVEESKHAKQIEKLVKSLFPNYSVVVIPNEYATIEGKKYELKLYNKKTNQEVSLEEMSKEL